MVSGGADIEMQGCTEVEKVRMKVLLLCTLHCCGRIDKGIILLFRVSSATSSKLLNQTHGAQRGAAQEMRMQPVPWLSCRQEAQEHLDLWDGTRSVVSSCNYLHRTSLSIVFSISVMFKS